MPTRSPTVSRGSKGGRARSLRAAAIALACGAFVVEACATATQEDLLDRGDDDDAGSAGSAARGGTSGTGFGGTGFGGSSGSAATGGTGAQGGSAGTAGQGGSGGTSGTGAGQAGDTGEGGAAGAPPDPCVVDGELPELRVDYRNTRNTVAEDPAGEYRIINTSTEEVPLSELSLRYWMRSEYSCSATVREMTISVNDFRLQNPHVPGDPASDVTRSVVEVAPDGVGCELYFMLGFSEDAGVLLPMQRVDISLHVQIAIYTGPDFTGPKNQSNDWSYGACQTMPVFWDRITLYRNGSLVSGREPPGAGGGGGAGGEGGAAGEAGAGGQTAFP